MKAKKLLFTFSLLLLCQWVAICQETDTDPTADWPTLLEDTNAAGLEANPLKGIAANFGSDNEFPYSISNITFTYGELVKDELVNGKPDYNYQLIDTFLDTVAQSGRVGMIQINLDNGLLINPLDTFTDENGNETYVGEKHDLPDFLNSVNRIYYQGRPKKISAEGVEPEIFEEQLTDPSQNVFPWDVPGQTATEFFGDFAGNPSMLPDYNDENLINAIEDLIVAFGNRYDSDDRLFIIHYGIYGIYGEWDLGAAKVYIDDLVDEDGTNLGLKADDWKMTFTNQEKIIDAYQTAFTKTNLVARTPNLPKPESVGFSDGLFFGGSVSNNPEFEFFFHPTLKKFNVDKNWKNNIIGGEMDPALQPTIWGRDMGVRDDFDFIVNGDPNLTKGAPDQNVADAFDLIHPTFIFQNFMLSKQFIGASNGANYGRGDDNLAKNPVPPNSGSNTIMWENGLKVNKKLGYTFHINKYQLSATANKPIVEVNIQNKGIAPMYADWAVEFGYLVDGSFVSLGSATDWSLSAIQPQTVEGVEASPNNYRLFSSDIEFPDANGTYTVGLRIVNPLRDAYPSSPWVAFANETQDQDQPGWLTLGDVVIVDGESETDTPIEVTNVETTPADRNINMIFYDRIALSATAMPEGANTDINWESSNPNLASVDSNGVVTTTTIAGEVEITAFTSNPDVKAVFTINVAPFILVSDTNGDSVTVEAEDYLELFGTDDNDSVFDDPGVGGFINGAGEVVRFVQNLKSNSYIDYGVSVAGGAQDFTIKFDYNAIFSGKFDLQIKNANANDTEFKTFSRISFPTLLESGEIPLKADGSVDFDAGSKIYKTFASKPFLLENGEYIIRFKIIDTGFNLDALTFSTVNVCAQVPAPITGDSCDDGNPTTFDDVYDENCRCTGTPRSSIVNTIPGRVEAEDYLTSFKISEGSNFDASIVENFTPESYLDYKVNVLNSDFVYSAKVNAASSKDFEGKGELQIQLLNEDKTTIKETVLESLEIIETENWNTYGNDSKSIGFNLPEGEQTLRIRPVGENTKFNLDWIEIKEDVEENPYVSIPNIGDEVIEGDAYFSIPEGQVNGQFNITEGDVVVGSAIGNISDGDEFTYAVSVQDGGADFELSLRASSPFNSGAVDIVFKNAQNEDVTETLNFDPSTPDFDYNVYAEYMSGKFRLEGGEQTITLRVPVGKSAFNLDWIQLKEAEEVNPYVSIPNSGDEVIEADAYFSIPEGQVNGQFDITEGDVVVGSAIGNISDGDEFTYAVSVQDGGADFELSLRASSPFNSGAVDIVYKNAQNEDVTKTLNFDPSTPDFDYNVYAEFTSGTFRLEGGEQTITLRVPVGKSAFNLDWIKFREAEEADTVKPIITLIGDADINLFVGEDYEELGATAIDDLDGDLFSSIVIGGDVVDTSLVETYTITYEVSDLAGNAADQVIRTVTISELPDTEVPMAICADLTIALDANGMVTITAEQLDGGSTDNEAIAEISIDKDTFGTNDLGENEVTLTVEDTSGNVSSCLAIVTVETFVDMSVLSITRFILVDSESDLDVQELVEGDVIDLSSLPTDKFNIRVETTDDVQSVSISLNGPVSNKRKESAQPFALFGDRSGDYSGRKFKAGSYSISADPFSRTKLRGDKGTSSSVNFEIIHSQENPEGLLVSRFVLVDADSNQDIQELVEGDVINLSDLPTDKLNIRVETTDDVKSVSIQLNGPSSKTKKENARPFALYGDKRGNYKGKILTAGDYNISANPFSENSLGGILGTSLSVNFTLLEDGLSGKSVQVTEETNKPDRMYLYPNPASIETTLNFDVPTEVGPIYIFDMTGRIVQTIKGGLIDKTGIRVDVQELLAGLYFVRTTDINGVEYQQRLLIERP